MIRPPLRALTHLAGVSTMLCMYERVKDGVDVKLGIRPPVSRQSLAKVTILSRVKIPEHAEHTCRTILAVDVGKLGRCMLRGDLQERQSNIHL